MDRLSIKGHQFLEKIDLELAERKNGIELGVRRCSPSNGPHPREQLSHPEGFGYEVIRTGVKSCNLFFLTFPHRDDNDGQLRPRPQPLDHVTTLQAGEAEIQQKKIEVFLGYQRERAFASAGRENVIAPCA